jgi:hypothetical protein
MRSVSNSSACVPILAEGTSAEVSAGIELICPVLCCGADEGEISAGTSSPAPFSARCSPGKGRPVEGGRRHHLGMLCGEQLHAGVPCRRVVPAGTHGALGWATASRKPCGARSPGPYPADSISANPVYQRDVTVAEVREVPDAAIQQVLVVEVNPPGPSGGAVWPMVTAWIDACLFCVVPCGAPHDGGSGSPGGPHSACGSRLASVAARMR